MPEHRWLVLHFEAPLISFGGVAIDQVGPTRDFPAASMLTGLLANALGYLRTDSAAHQQLQDRLVFAARLERESLEGVLTDTQNAQLFKNERGWTTWGTPEGRDGASYGAPHRRRRDYHTDAHVTLVIRLERVDEAPSLDDVAAALERPARPLFIGRKPCLPSAPIWRGEEVFAPTAYDALRSARAEGPGDHRLRALWPAGEGPSLDEAAVSRLVDLPDLRNWRSGLHGSSRQVVEGFVDVSGGAG